MNRVLHWAWATFVGLSALAFILTTSVATSLALGAVAGLCTLVASRRVTEQWRRRADAFASAARGLAVDPAIETEREDDSVGFAREVQAAALSSRETTRKLSVLRAVIDGMAEGVWITAEEGTVVRHNNARKEFLYTGQEIVGRRPGLWRIDLQTAVDKACRETPLLDSSSVEGVRPCCFRCTSPGPRLGGSSAVFFDV